MELIILVVYGLALSFIFIYSIVQLQLVFNYLYKKKKDVKAKTLSHWPKVTIQLPVYNEKYVLERLVRSITELDYPKDKLEIQLLDDSTDDSLAMAEKLCAEYGRAGFDIHHIQRKDRQGYKAGALKNGMEMAKGEFIAIFDADFVPQQDFLKKTLPYFEEERIGMIQTRWEHINENYNWLTRLQAFGLNAHFSVEQGGRAAGGHFINFNGTAGVWRKSCIIDAGGWSADTLTEDLDLSYRAQLRGWKFKFMEEIGSPAELPAEMNALKTQQYRWTKGAAECTRKNLGKMLRSGKFSASTKLNGIFHLLNSSLFICIVVVSLLSIPILFIKHRFTEYLWLYKVASVFLLGVFFLGVFYYISFKRDHAPSWKSLLHFLWKFPMFLAVSMGLSLHNGLAAFEGLIGRKTPFVRTPKFNLVGKDGDWKKNQYSIKKIGKLTYLEILLTFYFAFGLYLSFYLGDFGLMPFLAMLFFGYFFVSFLSVKHALAR